jgi:micrococcal nuclease
VLSTYPPDVQYVDEIRAAQAFAQRHGLGLWTACGSAAAPAGAPEAAVGIAAPTPAPAANIGGNCHPAYPDSCIPGGPDLDCGDIPDRRFRVLPPDPHNFDGDRDGIGCESG